MDINFTLIKADRRSVSIKISESGDVIVRAPRRMKQSDINAVVDSHKAWILKHRDRVLQKKENTDGISPRDKAILRRIAANTLGEMTRKYSALTGLYPAAVKITDAKGRFGSCSSKKNINYSYLLMLYPMEAIEYVVLHELCHLKYMNHSKEFYALVEKHMPDWKRRKDLLEPNHMIQASEIIGKCKISDDPDEAQ